MDHQSVVIEFENGATATHNMVGGTARPSRSIHVIGSTGEIQGVLEDNAYVIRHIDNRPGHEYRERVVNINEHGDIHGEFGGHAGGDMRLVADFVSLLGIGEPSISSTSLDDSIYGHLVGFRADAAMGSRRVESIPTW